jgi:DNA-binding NtrC family response regulator
MDGMGLLEAVKKLRPETEVIVISAQGTIEKAVQAMKMGAFDFIEKPINPKVIALVVERALEKQTLVLQNRDLRSQLEDRFHFRNIVGKSEKMVRIFELIRHIASYDSSVLIIGESGTGKELIANAIHYHSPRASLPFIKVSCASLSEGIIESELFGHEKGAFTGAITSRKGRFELAHGGTLFLDEVEDIPPSTQIKLLRVLQEAEFERVGGNKTLKVDIRVIAASNRDPQEAVEQGTFREDLYYRLNVVNIKLPPLRERREDIPFLIQFFIEKYNQKYQMSVKGVSQRTINALADYHWKGNVRELENTMERVAVMTDEEVILPKHFPLPLQENPEGICFEVPKTSDELRETKRHLRDKAVEDIERLFVLAALARNEWNVTRSAKDVGMLRPNFQALMRKHNIKSTERED